jgi:hypothetical protein
VLAKAGGADLLEAAVGIEQFVDIFNGIRSGRLGAAELNRALVTSNDCVDRRILPRAQTFEAKLVFVIGEGDGNVLNEELRRNNCMASPST